MQKNLVLVLGLASVISSSVAFGASSYHCADDTWVTTPSMEGDYFRGERTTTCTISDATTYGIAVLDDFMSKHIADGATINQGPKGETFEGVPSKFYDITAQSEAATVRSDIHLASDRSAKLFFVSKSTHTSGTGWATYLRGLDVNVEVTQVASNPRAYTVKLTTLTLVKRPWFAPPPAFLQTAISPMKDQFAKERDRTLAQYTAALTN